MEEENKEIEEFECDSCAEVFETDEHEEYHLPEFDLLEEHYEATCPKCGGEAYGTTYRKI